MLLQANKNILCKNQIRMQNKYEQLHKYEQFNYEQLHISAKTTEIKLLRF